MPAWRRHRALLWTPRARQGPRRSSSRDRGVASSPSSRTRSVRNRAARCGRFGFSTAVSSVDTVEQCPDETREPLPVSAASARGHTADVSVLYLFPGRGALLLANVGRAAALRWPLRLGGRY